MIRLNTKTPHFFVWGLLVVLIVSSLFVSCGNSLTTWENEGYKVSYDANVFTDITSDSEVLNLSIKDDDGLVTVKIYGFHPFALEQEMVDYFDAAQVAFQDEFSKITNNTKEDNLQYGIHDRRVSLSGKHDDHEGVAMGLMRVLISNETLLHVGIIGNSKTMMSNMTAIQEVLNSAEITK